MSAHILVEFSLGRLVSYVGVVELLLDAVEDITMENFSFCHFFIFYSIPYVFI